MTNLSYNSAGIISYICEEYMTHLLVCEYYYFVLRTATFLSFISPNHRVKKKIL